ncbi:NtaA/DmoA family FMN-dependent monooxygenase [Agrococcus beijingensis]|uniref:NtaA/DmoA family FMN-dependent monooxygenase n=1 Tax=Agrococcus beijingensis TaxID=3068634 RepID=UPI0027410BE1|nr:NtaA/DmoA family FMN-dependent monooxygenase [Agrococcus sp. REN33]
MATTIIGLLPKFAQIGWWAVVGLIVLRLLQGLSAGAERGGSALLSVEHSPARHRGLFRSFTQVGSSAGMLLATGAFFLVQHLLTAEQFADFGWRIPFLASAALVVVGLWIRLGVEDTAEFTDHRATGAVPRAPLAVLLRHHWRPVLVTIGLRLGQNAAEGLDRRLRRDRRLRLGEFAFLDAGPLSLLPLLLIVGINLAHESVYGPQPAWFAEQFPVHVRYSGVSFGYQVGSVLGGGLMPMIAALLLAAGGGTPWLIAGCLSVLAASPSSRPCSPRIPRATVAAPSWATCMTRPGPSAPMPSRPTPRSSPSPPPTPTPPPTRGPPDDPPLLLSAFDMLVPAHQSSGLWRHPESQATRFDRLDYWTTLARTLEEGGFLSLFLADIPGVYDVDGDGIEAAARGGVQYPVLDPLVAVPAMAAVTERLGFGVTASVTYESPYLLARTLTTLDHFTGGRVAWNTVTSYHDSAARNLGYERQLPHDLRYDRADEYMEVMYKLFDGSFEPGAVVDDKAAGVYLDPERVHPVEHAGEWFQVPGYALAHPGPQGTPFLFQAGASKRGQEFSLDHAEAIFFSGSTPQLVRRWVDGVRQGLVERGRAADAVRILSIATVVVADTDEEAEARLAAYREHVDVEGARALRRVDRRRPLGDDRDANPRARADRGQPLGARVVHDALAGSRLDGARPRRVRGDRRARPGDRRLAGDRRRRAGALARRGRRRWLQHLGGREAGRLRALRRARDARAAASRPAAGGRRRAGRAHPARGVHRGRPAAAGCPQWRRVPARGGAGRVARLAGAAVPHRHCAGRGAATIRRSRSRRRRRHETSPQQEPATSASQRRLNAATAELQRRCPAQQQHLLRRKPLQRGRRRRWHARGAGQQQRRLDRPWQRIREAQRARDQDLVEHGARHRACRPPPACRADPA